MAWSKWNNPDGSRVPCMEEGCGKPVRSTGLCNSHYLKRRNAGSLPEHLTFKGWNNPDGTRKVCVAPECGKPVFSKNLCQMHYTRMSRYGSLEIPESKLPTCPVSHCDKKMLTTSTVCKRCYQKSWRYGLSADQYIWMSRPENYRCHNPGCGDSERLHLDHDHSCCEQASNLRGGKKACGNCVRGWLCSNCNTALGLLQESEGRILGLVDYMKSVSRA